MRSLLPWLLLPFATAAQTPRQDSLLRDAAALTPSFWQLGGNAAALAEWNQPDFGRVTLGYHQTDGRFRRPQEPASRRRGGLRTEGLRRLNGWSYYGAFAYEKTADRDLRYLSGYEAYGGNPLLWADTLSGDWQRDHIRADVALGSPRLGRKTRAGLGLYYHVGQGARSREPKPLYRFRDLALSPSLWWERSGKQQWGLVGRVRWVQEENEVGYFASDFPLLYRLRGYGSFSRTPTVSAERRVAGTETAAWLQSRRSGRAGVLWLAQLGGGWRTERIREGIANPTDGGTYRETWVEGTWSGLNAARTWPRRLTLEGRYWAGAANDPVLKIPNASFRRGELIGTLETWRTKAHHYRHAEARFRLHSEGYTDGLTRLDWQVLALSLNLEASGRWKRGESRWLWARSQAGFRQPLAQAYAAGRPSALTPVLVRPDYAVATAPAALLGGAMGLDFRVNAFPSLWHRLALEASGGISSARFDDGTPLGQRSTWSLRYSIFY